MVIGSRRWHVLVSENGSTVQVEECHLRDASGAVDPTQQCFTPNTRYRCDYGRRTRNLKSTNVTLPLVCQQFYREAAKLEWQNYVFQINCQYPDSLGGFLKRLSNWQLKAIRTLHVHYDIRLQFDDYMWRRPFRIMSQMSSLRHLIINPLVDGRTPQETWEKIRPQLMALRPLNVDLDGVFVLACPIMEMCAASPSFIDLTE